MTGLNSPDNTWQDLVYTLDDPKVFDTVNCRVGQIQMSLQETCMPSGAMPLYVL